MDSARFESVVFEVGVVIRKNLLNIFAASCLAFILPVSAPNQTRTSAVTANKSLTIEAGEELVYTAEFSRSLLHGLDVGEFKFNSSQGQLTPKAAPPNDPVNVLNLAGDVVSKGFFVRLFGIKFHEQIESTVDQLSLSALQTRMRDEQNNRVRESESVFDHGTRKVTWTEKDPGNPARPPRVVTAEFTEPVQDLLSGIYFLRTLPLDVGKSFEMVVSDSGRVVRVPISVAGRKRMKTVLGQVYALQLEPDVFGEGGLVRGAGRLSIWVTDDNRHIPVRAQIKVEAGNFEIKLKRYKAAAKS